MQPLRMKFNHEWMSSFNDFISSSFVFNAAQPLPASRNQSFHLIQFAHCWSNCCKWNQISCCFSCASSSIDLFTGAFIHWWNQWNEWLVVNKINAAGCRRLIKSASAITVIIFLNSESMDDWMREQWMKNEFNCLQQSIHSLVMACAILHSIIQ